MNRGRTDLIYELLEAINSGMSKPTILFHNLNISWKTYREITDLFKEAGIIQIEYILKTSTSKRRIYITEKGIKALHHFREFKRLVFLKPIKLEGEPRK